MPNSERDGMQANKTSYLLILLFFIVLLSVPFYWIFRTESYYGMSWLEGRRLTEFTDLVHRGFFISLKALARGEIDEGMPVIQEQLIQGQFQTDLKAVLSDQFPLRLAWIKAAKAVDRGMIQLAYLFTRDPAIPADRTSEYYVTRDRSALLVGPEPFHKSTFDVIDKRIHNYQVLLDQHPEVNFYVYYIERIQNVSAHPLDAKYENLERGQYYDTFLQNKPEGLTTAKFDINSFEDHLAYFFRTDHHWNIHGILRAYDEIYGLIAPNYPEISKQRVYEDFITFDDIRFRGSSARKAYHPMWEPFTVVDYDLPPYTVYDNGLEVTYGNKEDYFAGEFPQDPYFNHYEGFYGGDRRMLEFVFSSNPDRNLLVLGNSYNNALMPLLASHYHHTYDVDLRYYKDFSLSIFMAEYPVDDILVIGENSIVFGSEKYRIKP